MGLPVLIKDPCSFVKVQFQTYAVFSYLLYNKAMFMP